MNRLAKVYVRYRETVCYLVAGACTTAISLAVYYLCVLTVFDPEIPLELQTANALSFIAAVTFAYFSNRKAVFQSKNRHMLTEAFLFLLVRLFTLALDMGLMALFVTEIGFNDKLVKPAVQAVVIVANYIMSKWVVFRQKGKEKV